MNVVTRIKMLKAMEFIARHLNNEGSFEYWLMNGIADGDIESGDLSVKDSDAENLDYYLDDKTFADLMDSFVYLLQGERKDGLYVDGVTSKPAYPEEEEKLYTHNEASAIVEMFEDVLDRADITVPSPEDDERGEDNTARLYGTVYAELLDEVENGILNILEFTRNTGAEVVPYVFR